MQTADGRRALWRTRLALAKETLVRLAMTRRMGDGLGLVLPVDFSQREVFLLMDLRDRVREGDLLGDVGAAEEICPQSAK